MGGKSLYVRALESLGSAMTNVEHIYLLGFIRNAIDYPIDMRLVAVEEMTELGILQCFPTASRVCFKA